MSHHDHGDFPPRGGGLQRKMRHALQQWHMLRQALLVLSLRTGHVVGALCTGIATHVSALLLTGLSGWLILRAWQMPPVMYLSIAIVAVRALGLSRGLFRYLDRLTTHRIVLNGLRRARVRVYEVLAAGNPTATYVLRPGELAQRVGADLDAVGDVVIRVLLPMTVAACTALTATTIMAAISPCAALGLLGSAILVVIVVPLFTVQSAHREELRGVHAQNHYVSEVTDVLIHADGMQVSGTIEGAIARVKKAQNQVVIARQSAAISHAWTAAALPLATGISVLCVFLDPGVMTTAQTYPALFGVAVFVALAFLDAASAIPEACQRWSATITATQRLMTLMADAQGENIFLSLKKHTSDRSFGKDTPYVPVVAPRVWAHNLSIGWPHSVAASLGRLMIAPGDRVAVLGPSGSGKSSLLLTLAGFLPPIEGELHGVNSFAELSREDPPRHSHTAFFPEDGYVFETSIRENLMVANGAAALYEIDGALAAVGLSEWVNSLPHGVDTVLVGGSTALSSGQRRRLLLARVVLSPAPVLLLDEPTEHLDSESSQDLLRRLLDPSSGLIAAEKTVVVATHHCDAVQGFRILDLTIPQQRLEDMVTLP